MSYEIFRSRLTQLQRNASTERGVLNLKHLPSGENNPVLISTEDAKFPLSAGEAQLVGAHLKSILDFPSAALPRHGIVLT